MENELQINTLLLTTDESILQTIVLFLPSYFPSVNIWYPRKELQA